VIRQVQVWPPLQPGQTELSGAQKEWVRKVKKESSKKRAKALQDREEAEMEAEMGRIWDQEETRMRKRPRLEPKVGSRQNYILSTSKLQSSKCPPDAEPHVL
jgi:hypothetical protein